MAVVCDPPSPPPPQPSCASACAPLASARVVRPLMLFLTLAIRVAILIVLILAGAYDLTFYTYVNLSAITILSTLGIIGLWVSCVQRFYMRWIFPVMLQSTLFVSFAITAIVQLNSAIYMMHTASLGGPVADGTLHTGDFIVHQFTAILILVDLIVQHHYARTSVRSLWLSSGRAFRVFYAFYVLLAAMAPLGLYALIEDWNSRYPTGVSPWLVWAVGVPLMCALIGGFYLLFMLSTDDIAHCGGCAHPCDACSGACSPAVPRAPLLPVAGAAPSEPSEPSEPCAAPHSAKHGAARRRAHGAGTLPAHAYTTLDPDTLGAVMDEHGIEIDV